ncbi:MAG: site-specific integrase [Muribaculaceae bacterium]|nr:site-specific integrase [Muribaculaceae bacterium]
MSIRLKFRESTKPDKEGTLFYQVIHERETRRIKSKHRIYACEWEDETESIIVPPLGAPRYNILSQIASDCKWDVQRLNDIEKMLGQSKTVFSVDDIVTEFERYSDTISVLTFLHQQSERLMALGRVRGSEMLKTTMNRFSQFRGGLDLSFAMLDSDLLQKFEAFLKNEGLMRNTIGFYMRTLRTAYNNAVERGLAESTNPFKHVYTGKDKTIKRALSPKQMKDILALDLTSKPNLEFARDMFMFSLYARGMAFVDMAYLRKKDLQGTHFTYCRRKTGQMLMVEWIFQMQQILDKYKTNPTQYLLPIITNAEKSDRRQYLNQSENINKALKEIATLANIDVSLTMYWSRHTWSTVARNSNISISVISEALGHDNEKTTQIYLDSIQSSVVDKANRMVIKGILK